MRRDAQRIDLRMYRQAIRLGLLSRKRAQRLFGRAYFTYKRRLEDPFHALTRRHPQFFMGGHAIDIGANIGNGMSSTLEANPTAAVVVEYCSAALRAYGAEPRELTRFFVDRGYGAFRMARSGMLEPIDLANLPEELPGFEYMDILFTKELSRAAT
jgi:hypothetical protein